MSFTLGVGPKPSKWMKYEIEGPKIVIKGD